ncbi:MAG: endonuclease III domain-containing protein [Nitrospinae bacterium]|nr:endonuclease III domain-containing protein [Nitrospinota bacterium]
MSYKERLLNIYSDLLGHFGQQKWWPAETRFEVCVGAILTQNTAWQNVEKAIANLKKEGVLNPQRLREVSIDKLAQLIIPSGYYNIKAKRLKEFVGFLCDRYNGDLDMMFSDGVDNLRDSLLQVKGIGPETADSILLYAGYIPIFVVDAYTKRIFSRLNLVVDDDISYDELQSFFMRNLTQNVPLFNEYHALIVMLGKNYCRRKPKCDGCPIMECNLRDIKKES